MQNNPLSGPNFWVLVVLMMLFFLCIPMKPVYAQSSERLWVDDFDFTWTHWYWSGLDPWLESIGGGVIMKGGPDTQTKTQGYFTFDNHTSSDPISDINFTITIKENSAEVTLFSVDVWMNVGGAGNTKIGHVTQSDLPQADTWFNVTWNINSTVTSLTQLNNAKIYIRRIGGDATYQTPNVDACFMDVSYAEAPPPPELYLPVMPLLGGSGFVLVIFTPYFFITRLRKKDDWARTISWSMIMFLLGVGFIIAWLWG